MTPAATGDRGREHRAPGLPIQAFAAWAEQIGADHIVRDAATLAAWGRRTFGRNVSVGAILRPGSGQEVAAALWIAGGFEIPVHPVSRGANWGMGSRAPMEEGGVILDLSRLTAIEDVSADHGVVRVQPGVTFQALARHLEGSGFFVSEIGGSPEASVLANALDRGDGALADRWAALGELTVALPDGRLIRTGYGGRGATALVGLHDGPAGPLVDGLFSQSNLGVVVEACLRLEPVPDNLAIFTARTDMLAGLPALLNALRDAQKAGALPDRGFTLWNGVKFLAREQSRTAFDADEIRQAESGTWRVSGYMTAESDGILQHRAAWVLDRLHASGARAEAAIARSDGAWEEGCEGLLGRPSPRNLRTAYWSEPAIPDYADMDPDGDGCGLLWLCLALPFDGEAAAEFVRCAVGVLDAHDIDLNIGLEPASFRCLLAYISLSYRRDGAAADADALAAYRGLMAAAEALGLAPYRLANGLPRSAGDTRTELDRYLAQLRAVGDPAGVLSRGRYGIGDG